MSRRPKTTKELSQWQREYDQVEQKWRRWLCHNLFEYGTLENAWYAFKAQWQGQTSILEIDAVFRGDGQSLSGLDRMKVVNSEQ